MKNIVILFLMLASVVSFAEPFSQAKFKELYTNGDKSIVGKYCYEADLSKQTNRFQCSLALYHMTSTLNIKDKESIDKQIEKFSNHVSKDNQTKIKIKAYFNAGLIEQSKKLALDNKLKAGMYQQIIFPFIKTKDYDTVWNISKQLLLNVGGVANPKTANNIIIHMFKYKPTTITKQQQIEVLSKIGQNYPIPGTDFNKWKEFMGFVGFKYKALTGKELF